MQKYVKILIYVAIGVLLFYAVNYGISEVRNIKAFYIKENIRKQDSLINKSRYRRDSLLMEINLATKKYKEQEEVILKLKNKNRLHIKKIKRNEYLLIKYNDTTFLRNALLIARKAK